MNEYPSLPHGINPKLYYLDIDQSGSLFFIVWRKLDKYKSETYIKVDTPPSSTRYFYSPSKKETYISYNFNHNFDIFEMYGFAKDTYECTDEIRSINKINPRTGIIKENHPIINKSVNGSAYTTFKEALVVFTKLQKYFSIKYGVIQRNILDIVKERNSIDPKSFSEEDIKELIQDMEDTSLAERIL